jgi:hypothetical protein
VVIAAVGHDDAGLTTWASPPAADRGDRLDERDELGDVVAVAAGQRHRERDPTAVADQMMFGASLAPVDRARTGVGAPLFRADVGGIHTRTRPVDPPCRVQLYQQHLMELVEHPGLGPVP